MSRTDSPADWTRLAGSRRQFHGVAPGRPLHRIAIVMEQECLAPRAAAYRMNLPMSQIRAEAQASCDLRLSDLYRWQEALNVPLADLLQEPDDGLSPWVAIRGQLLNAMKTVKSIQIRVDDEELQALAMTLGQQLTEMMPELAEVSAWPSQGRQRPGNEMGAIFDKMVPAEFFDQPFEI